LTHQERVREILQLQGVGVYIEGFPAGIDISVRPGENGGYIFVPANDDAAALLHGIPGFPAIPAEAINIGPLLNENSSNDQGFEDKLIRLTEQYPDYTYEDLEAIARDPDHNGRITSTSIEELEAALRARESGLVTGTITPSNVEGVDFIELMPDGSIQQWDVKTPGQRPTNPNYQTPDFDVFVENTYLGDIYVGEKILINTIYLTETEQKSLRQAIENNPKVSIEDFEFSP